MRFILCILCLVVLTSCADLKDEQGNTVVSGFSFGRDIYRLRDMEVEFDHPLTTEDIDKVRSINSWLSRFLIPGMVKLKLKEVLSSTSNVEGALHGLAEVGGTIINGASTVL